MRSAFSPVSNVKSWQKYLEEYEEKKEIPRCNILYNECFSLKLMENYL
jgi:hypothetical protein